MCCDLSFGFFLFMVVWFLREGDSSNGNRTRSKPFKGPSVVYDGSSRSRGRRVYIERSFLYP